MLTGADLDQLAAAAADTRRLIRSTLPGVGMSAGRGSPWQREVFDRLTLAPTLHRCHHLARHPLQPAFAFAWEGYWRCHRCVVGYAAAHRAAVGFGLRAAEDGVCDRCRRDVGPLNLLRAGMCDDMFVLVTALCSHCATLAR